MLFRSQTLEVIFLIPFHIDDTVELIALITVVNILLIIPHIYEKKLDIPFHTVVDTVEIIFHAPVIIFIHPLITVVTNEVIKFQTILNP